MPWLRALRPLWVRVLAEAEPPVWAGGRAPVGNVNPIV